MGAWLMEALGLMSCEKEGMMDVEEEMNINAN